MAVPSSNSQCPAELTQLFAQRPHELEHTDGYVWHKKSVLGKGSFGKVYKGWCKKTYEEVAVKVIRREHYANDPKVRENIRREIDIQGKLSDCVNILHLLHQERVRDGCMLVTELCDKDLQDYIKQSNGLGEAAVKDFLLQIADGLQIMYERGIAHRDLKPGNILLKRDPITRKMIVKLADFGFARTYLSEDEKTKLIMTSLAGTPVFMAPEALECVFHRGKSYNEKVDLWSVGALLYNCLVGKPGFYATLNDILHILNRKGNAIAFERTGSGVNYIYELPPVVNSRLSGPFKADMERLLQQLLVVDPVKRMTYQQFFDFVQRFKGPAVTVFQVGPGKQETLTIDTAPSCRQFCEMVGKKFHIPFDRLVVIVEASEEILDSLSSEQLPEILSGQFVLFVVDEQSLESAQEPACASVAMDRLREVLSNSGEKVKLAWNGGFVSLCDTVLRELTMWTNNQNKGWRCYKRLLEKTCANVQMAEGKLREITIRFETRVATIKECLQKDVELLTQLGGLEHISGSEVDECITQIEQLSSKCLSQLQELAAKFGDTIRHSNEEIQVPVRIDCNAVMAELKPLLDEIGRVKGDQAISKAMAFEVLSWNYFTKQVKALHVKMRSLYMQKGGAAFVLEEFERIEDDTVRVEEDRLSSLQHRCRQAVYASLMERVGAANSSAELLLQKTQELEDVNKKLAEEKELNQKMRIKVDKRDRQCQEKENECQELTERCEDLKKDLSKCEKAYAALSAQKAEAGGKSLDLSLATTNWEKIEIPGSTLKPSVAEAATVTKNEVLAAVASSAEDETVVLSASDLREESPLPNQQETETDTLSEEHADTVDGQETIVPKNVKSMGATLMGSVPHGDQPAAKLSLDDVRRACQCLKVSANFCSSAARILKVPEVDPLHRRTSTSVSDQGDVDSSGMSDLVVGSPDDPFRPWPVPSVESFLSVSDVSFSQDTDLVQELKKLTDILQSFDLTQLHRAVTATGRKLSVDNFGPEDCVLFWPTSEQTVFQAVTTSDKKIFLSTKKLSSRDKSTMLIAKLKRTPLSHVGKEGNKYKQPVGTQYYTVSGEVVWRLI